MTMKTIKITFEYDSTVYTIVALSLHIKGDNSIFTKRNEWKNYNTNLATENNEQQF